MKSASPNRDCSRGPIDMPGSYTVKLTVDGKSFTAPLTLKMDPRVKTPPAGLQQQFDLAQQVVALMHTATERKVPHVGEQLGRLLEIIEGADAAPTTQTVAAVAETQNKLDHPPAQSAQPVQP